MRQLAMCIATAAALLEQLPAPTALCVATGQCSGAAFGLRVVRHELIHSHARQPLWVASSGMFQGAAFEALVGAQCMVWTTVYVMEVIRADLRRHFNANVELDDPRLTIVADLAEFDYWRSPYSMGLAKQLASLVQEHYPEVMKRFLIVNAPWAFSAVWAVVKHFFDAGVVAKCALVGAASTHAALLEHIADDQIPQYLGGTFVPPDGDRECANFFCRCGALPDDATAEPELDAAVEGMTIELADIE